MSRRCCTTAGIALLAAVCCLSWSGETRAAAAREILHYEVMWNGARAAHGDITTHREGEVVNVMVQAVTDGALKRMLEIWSKIQAAFSIRTLKPQWYNYHLKSNWLRNEVIDLKFDHVSGDVTVSKHKGDEREQHKEKFGSAYDPVTAIFVLREKMASKQPTFVDVYDGKARGRLSAVPAGGGPVRVRCGAFPASKWNIRVVKLTGDRHELAKAEVWLSDDPNRIPLLLTANPVVGTVRFELVQMKR